MLLIMYSHFTVSYINTGLLHKSWIHIGTDKKKKKGKKSDTWLLENSESKVVRWVLFWVLFHSSKKLLGLR